MWEDDGDVARMAAAAATDAPVSPIKPTRPPSLFSFSPIGPHCAERPVLGGYADVEGERPTFSPVRSRSRSRESERSRTGGASRRAHVSPSQHDGAASRSVPVQPLQPGEVLTREQEGSGAARSASAEFSWSSDEDCDRPYGYSR